MYQPLQKCGLKTLIEVAEILSAYLAILMTVSSIAISYTDGVIDFLSSEDFEVSDPAGVQVQNTVEALQILGISS